MASLYGGQFIRWVPTNSPTRSEAAEPATAALCRNKRPSITSIRSASSSSTGSGLPDDADLPPGVVAQRVHASLHRLGRVAVALVENVRADRASVRWEAGREASVWVRVRRDADSPGAVIPPTVSGWARRTELDLGSGSMRGHA